MMGQLITAKKLWLIVPAIMLIAAIAILILAGDKQNQETFSRQSKSGELSEEAGLQNKKFASSQKPSETIRELKDFTGTPEEFANKLESAYALADKQQRTQLLSLCETRIDKSLIPFLKRCQVREVDADLRLRILNLVLSSPEGTSDDILISNLGHFDTNLAHASLKAIRKRIPEGATSGLVKYLNRPDVKDRWIAVDVLADIGGAEALKAIEKCATNGNTDKQARLRAITALGKLKVRGSLVALEGNLNDKDEQIRLITLEVIKAIKQH